MSVLYVSALFSSYKPLKFENSFYPGVFLGGVYCITSLSSPQFQERVKVEIVASDKINRNQGLLYNHYFNIPDIEDNGNELKKEYNLLDVKKQLGYQPKTSLLLHSY